MKWLGLAEVMTCMNKKTPVISRSLFINQKTNSHDNCCYCVQFTIFALAFQWG
mgnify:CR=1